MDDSTDWAKWADFIVDATVDSEEVDLLVLYERLLTDADTPDHAGAVIVDILWHQAIGRVFDHYLRLAEALPNIEVADILYSILVLVSQDVRGCCKGSLGFDPGAVSGPAPVRWVLHGEMMRNPQTRPPGRSRLSKAERIERLERFAELVERGLSHEDAASKLGYSLRTIQRDQKWYREATGTDI